nr:lisH domain-containing protein C1711.05-like [Ipomoea batatas]
MRRMKYQGNDKASRSRTHDKDELQVLCYNCRKPGHFKAECPYPIVKKHQDEHNYKKNSGRYHHPKNNPNDVDEESSKNQKNDKRRKALAVEENTGEKNEESCTSSSSSESDSSEDEKGLLCLFSQEDSDEEMCLMAEEEEVTSQNQSFNYSSESVCHENHREAFEKMMKSFYGIKDSHIKLKEENVKLLAERQDLEDLKSKNAEMLESISQLEKQMRRMKYQGNDKASGSRTHDKDELQVLCYNCQKPGHFKAECPYPIVKKHQDEHNYKKNSGRYHHPKNNPNDADEDSSSESDSSEDEKGLLCLFSQEDSDEEMCLMAEEEEVTSQNQSFNYSSESVCHENPREAFEKMMKSFYGIEDSHIKLKEENVKLLAERQDLEDLKSKNAEMLESISQLEKQDQNLKCYRMMKTRWCVNRKEVVKPNPP